MKETNYMKIIGNKFYDIPKIDDLCEILKEKFKSQEERLEKIETENEELKKDLWLNKKIQELKKENEEIKKDLLRGFPISEHDEILINNWMREHSKSCSRAYYSYRFHPIPGIGVSGECVCEFCKKKFVFYDS